MKLLKVTLCIVAFAILLASVKCPEDGTGAFFTGNTRNSDGGQLMKEYKCSGYGHLFWLPS